MPGRSKIEGMGRVSPNKTRQGPEQTGDPVTCSQCGLTVYEGERGYQAGCGGHAVTLDPTHRHSGPHDWQSVSS